MIKKSDPKLAGRLMLAGLFFLCLVLFPCQTRSYAAKNKDHNKKEHTRDGITVHVTDQPEKVALNTDTADPLHMDPVSIDTDTGQVKTRSGKRVPFGRVFNVSEAKEKKIISGSKKKKRQRINGFLQQEEIYSVDNSNEDSIEVVFPFVFKRIALFISQGSLKDSHGALAASYYLPGQDYILDYPTEEAAKEAYDLFRKEYGDDRVIPDLVVSIDESDVTADASKSYSRSEAFTETEALSVSWGNDMMHLDAIRDNINADSSFKQKVKVAVLDTGINSSHEMFADRIADGGKSFVSSGEETPDSYEDFGSHGTHVSGIIADGTPDLVKILPIKVLNSSGKGGLAEIINALEYIHQEGADVANMSFSLDMKDYTMAEIMSDETVKKMESCLKKLTDSGCPCIVTAGNKKRNIDEPGRYIYPAISSYATAVSFINSDKEFVERTSCFGNSVAFTAPGEKIISAGIDGSSSYVSKSGTSMAVPHIAGACAVLKVLNKSLSAKDTIDQLTYMCEDLGESGKDIYYGYGLIRYGFVTLVSSAANVYPDEDINIHIYAPSASKIMLYCDDVKIGEASGESVSFKWSLADIGKHTFLARSLTGDMEYTSNPVTVTVSPLKEIDDNSQLPDMLYEGVDGKVILRLPEDAAGLSYRIYDKNDPDSLDINPKESFSSDQIISIAGDKIISGHTYRIEYSIKAGRGYMDYEGEKEIVASKNPSTSQTIKVSWDDDDNRQGLRKEMTASLYNKKNPSELLGQALLTKSNNWSAEIADQLTYNPDGSRADYGWNVEVPSCYQASAGSYDYATTTFKLGLKHSLTKTPAKAARLDAEGNIEYYTCSICHKLFSDASGRKEISQADTALAKLTPEEANINPPISLVAYNQEIALKKGGTATLTLNVRAKDPAKAVTGALSALPAKAGVVKITSLALKGNKLVFKVKGLKAGTTNINVKVGSKTAIVKVTVVKKANPAKKVTASKKKVSMKRGGIKKLLVKISPKTKKYLCTDAVTASSSKEKVASITSISVKKGKAIILLHAAAKGKAKVTVKTGKAKVKINISVK